MSIVGEVFVRVRPDTTGFGRATAAQVTRETRAVERQAQQSSVRIAGYAKAALLGLGALGVGVGTVLVKSVKAAEESQKVQAQLANALNAQSISLDENRAAIDARTQALSQMSGFDDELITTTFVNFVRRTGDVTKALNLNAIAVDVARGRNISLEASSALVTRASLGMAGSLRRVGIAAKDGASATELLNLLQRKYAGSAEAYGKTAVGAQERFQVALENTEEIIGTAVLPTLTKLLNRTTDWLNDADNQKRLQDFVNESVDRGTSLANSLADGWGHVQDATDFLRESDPFGGKSLKDMASFGRSSALDDLVAKFKALADAQKRIAAGYSAIEAARDGADVTKAPRSFDLPQVSGRGFVGRPLTAAEQLAIALATNPDDVSALQAQRAQFQRALDFAKAQVAAQTGNTTQWAKDIEFQAGKIQQVSEHLATIAAEKARKAEEARLAAIAALIPNSIGGRGVATGAFGKFQSAIAATLGGRFAGKGQADTSAALGQTEAQTEAALRLQIAEANGANEKKLVALNQALLAADRAHLALLKKIGATEEAKLQEQLNIAQVKRRIRELGKKEKTETGGGFTLAELFTEAANEQGLFGSNIGTAAAPLSPQEGRGALGAQIMVQQNFYGEKPNPAQALMGAAQAAKALRLG